MVKTYKQIDDEIKEVRRKLQQSRLVNLYNKTIADESVKNEITMESTEEIRKPGRS
jgi:hypothetical protein